MNMSYEQTLKAVDNILRKDAGCSTSIDYIEQTSWILFLKYLSDLEKERIDEATLFLAPPGCWQHQIGTLSALRSAIHVLHDQKFQVFVPP